MAERKIVYDRELSHKRHNGVTSTLLIEKITRERVFDSLYYKQYCFDMNAATLMDKAIELECVGSFQQSGSPFPFVCLLVKLIQLLPSREIIEFYVSQHRFKYLKVLGLLYIRIVYKDYAYLKLRLNEADYRKLRLFENGEFKLTFMDQVIDNLIRNEFFIGLRLTYMKRDDDDE